MKNLLMALLLTMSSTAYCNDSWTPEDIRSRFHAGISNGVEKLMTESGDFPENLIDRYKINTLKDAREIFSATLFSPEDIIDGYNAGMLNDPEKFMSVIGYVSGVYSTISAMHQYGLINAPICSPEKLNITKIMDAINEINIHDFPRTNEGTVQAIYSALSDNDQCNIDNVNDLADYMPEGIFNRLRATIMNDSEALISAVDYVNGVISTLTIAQDNGLIDDSVCMPDQLTIGEIRDALNELDMGGFSETNTDGIVSIFSALFKKDNC